MVNRIQKIKMFSFLVFFKENTIGGSKHSLISALPGLDRKKIIFDLLKYSGFTKSEDWA
jgi:hypothetical protein